MKKIWLPMLIVGILLLAAVLIVTPITMMQLTTIEPIASYHTPLQVAAYMYWQRVVASGVWIRLLVIGALLIVAAVVIRMAVRKQK